jgi:hypothetical protein
MSLFGKKKQIRFETITVDRERDVFRALENKGWTLCTDPFQFDVQKSHDKLRKDAMKMAHEMHAELLVEVWDPIYQHMHWKGLKYSAWRRATNEEIIERMRKKQERDRPDYSDSLGSYETIAQKLEQKKIHVSEEDLHQYDSVLKVDEQQMVGEVYGDSNEDMGMVTEHFDTVSSLNPYDHQGERQSDIRKDRNIDHQAASQGPVFDESQKLELEEGPIVEEKKEIDPLALMMEAAPPQESLPQPVPETPAPQVSQPAQPPQVAQQPQPPANTPLETSLLPQVPPSPPALGPPPGLPGSQPAQQLPPQPPAGAPKIPPKKEGEDQGQ